MTLQRSALQPLFSALGATYQQRFGWELPAFYSDPAAEYRAATTAVGLCDASPTGRLRATGSDGLDLLNRLSTNKVVGLLPGEGAPTVLTTDRGRILDLVAVVHLGDSVLLLTSPGTQRQVIDWLDRYTIMEDLKVEDITQQTTMLSVLGPESASAVAGAAGLPLGNLSPYHTRPGEVAGHPVGIICRPLGELPRFDLLVSHAASAAVWQKLVAEGIPPVGEVALEAARLHHAVPSYGAEMGDSYNPLEVGLIGSIDFAKGCYIGQEVIARLDTYHKVQKHLVKLQFSPDAVVSEGDALYHDGLAVGTVTSFTRLPTGGDPIGLGFVRTKSASVGNQFHLAAPAAGRATIVALPLLFGPGLG